MISVATIAETRKLLEAARGEGKIVGVVPTMGFLHDGHVSLMAAARRECDLVMATIFVNPLQFGPGEDLDAYPRNFDGDAARCEAAGVDVLLAPSVAEMFPRPTLTQVSVPALANLLDGASRPGHFDGVATVVSKLFNISGPCRAYFGEKDWQQLQVITRMAGDLSFPVHVVGCPIIRETDGLAMSSRNVYLDEAHRGAARVLSRSLRAGVDAVASGETEAVAVRELVEEVIRAEPLAELDYVAVVDATMLEMVDKVGSNVRILVAATVGPARLIDNTDACSPGTLMGSST